MLLPVCIDSNETRQVFENVQFPFSFYRIALETCTYKFYLPFHLLIASELRNIVDLATIEVANNNRRKH